MLRLLRVNPLKIISHPVIDHYPNCDYEVLKKARSSTIKESGLNLADEKAELIKLLRQDAADTKADALNIEKITLENPLTLDNQSKRRLTMLALLINTCESDTSLPTTYAKYDETGERLLTTSKQKTTYSWVLNSKPEYVRPELSNNEISLESGAYGVKLGSSYQEVLDAFGHPSVELYIYEQQKVVGYGRNHWFYFIDEQLVRVQNEERLLNYDVSNQIPMWPFFDDHQWHIDGKIKNRMLFTEAEKQLDDEIILNDKRQLVMKGDTAELVVHFHFIKNHFTLEKINRVGAFDYRTTNYPEPVLKSYTGTELNFARVTDIFERLQVHREKVQLSDIGKEALGVIWLSPSRQLQLVNHQLISMVQKNRVKEIQFFPSVLFEEQNMESDKQWYLGNFEEGKTLGQLRPYFFNGAIEMDWEVMIDSDNYHLMQLFDEDKGEPKLHQAVLTIY